MSVPGSRPLALVTGASSGIGLELAKQLAAAGFDVVAAAEDAELRTAAAQIEQHGAQVEAVQADLATDEGVDELWRRTQATGRPLAVACLNAGIGSGGPFAETPLERELRLVDLNVRSVVHLGKHVVQHMVAAGEGRILVTSSIASTMPGPYQAVYNASKSFVQSFAIALRKELEDTGVTVTSLMPGPTETDFFERAGLEDTKLGQGPQDSAEDVAKDGLEALMAGKERVESASLMTKLQGRGSRFLPDSAKAAAHAKMAEPGSADPEESK